MPYLPLILIVTVSLIVVFLKVTFPNTVNWILTGTTRSIQEHNNSPWPGEFPESPPDNFVLADSDFNIIIANPSDHIQPPWDDFPDKLGDIVNETNKLSDMNSSHSESIDNKDADPVTFSLKDTQATLSVSAMSDQYDNILYVGWFRTNKIS